MNPVETKQIAQRIIESQNEPDHYTVYEAADGNRFDEIYDAEIYNLFCAVNALGHCYEDTKALFAEVLRCRTFEIC